MTQNTIFWNKYVLELASEVVLVELPECFVLNIIVCKRFFVFNIVCKTLAILLMEYGFLDIVRTQNQQICLFSKSIILLVSL